MVERLPVHYTETGSLDPCYNLALEQYLLENRREGDWLLLWQNANTVVVGLNQNTEEEINRDFVQVHGITVVRRMTGGGAVYHDLGNLNYSFITDTGDVESLSIQRFTEPVCRALRSFGLEAETSGRNDILVRGKKVSGVAQRIVGNRILHHGTLLFDSDPDMIAGALKTDPEKFRSKSVKSVRSRIGNLRDMLPESITLPEFKMRILSELTRQGLTYETLQEAELAEINRLAEEKYRSPEWTYGRNPDYSYRNRRRFPGGTLEVRMDVQKGTIRDLVFFGDFMATAPMTELTAKLCGTPLKKELLREKLAGAELSAMFGEITERELLALILDEKDSSGSFEA